MIFQNHIQDFRFAIPDWTKIERSDQSMQEKGGNTGGCTHETR